MITRRVFLKGSALAGAALFTPWKGSDRGILAALIGGSLNAVSIPKYQMPLVIPPAMPKTARIRGVDYYEIGVRQFQQQILPTGMPMTTVWSYGSSRLALPLKCGRSR